MSPADTTHAGGFVPAVRVHAHAVQAVAEANILQTQRAADVQRDRYAGHLADCFATGRLSAHEFQVRHALAEDALTVSALQALITDLPPLPVPIGVVRQERWQRCRRWVSRSPGRPWLHTIVAALGAVWIALPPSLLAHGSHWAGHGPAGPVVVCCAVLGGITEVANFVWLMAWADR